MIAQPKSSPAAAGRPSSGISPVPIRKAAVLGSGTMGARIAAHLANAGLPVVMLDIASKDGTAAGIAAQALENLKRGKPAAFYDPALAVHIRTGNFDDDLKLLADCDWVIEAVTENLAIKQALLDEDRAAPEGRGASSPPTPAACRFPRSPRTCRTTSAAAGLARTSSTRRATCGCWRSSPRPRPTPPRWKPSRASPTCAWARKLCLRATRRTSSPTASAFSSCWKRSA